MKFSFLHMADLHLGYNQYGSKERFNDFAKAAAWAAQEAVSQEVSFVVIAGDLFHKRSNLQPTTLRQAEHFLKILKNAGIPCVMIEGNHDRPLYRDKGITWCQYLAQHGLVTLLNFIPESSESLIAANQDTVGSFFEVVDKVFVFGVGYKGAGLRATLNALVSPLHEVSQDGAYSLLAVHAGLQGQLPEHVPDTLDLGCLKPFETSVDYIALGHYHKPFQLEEWIYNPGSLEVTAWDQYRPEQPGGLKMVDVDTDQVPKHRVTHLPSPIRPRIKERFDIGKATDSQELGVQFESYLQRRWQNVHKAESKGTAPILQVMLEGELKFEAFKLNLQELVDRAERICNPLVCHLTLVDRPELSIGENDGNNETLKEVEHRVLREMIMQHPSYCSEPDRWLNAVKNTSELVLGKAEPQLVYESLSAFDCFAVKSEDMRA